MRHDHRQFNTTTAISYRITSISCPMAAIMIDSRVSDAHCSNGYKIQGDFYSLSLCLVPTIGMFHLDSSLCESKGPEQKLLGSNSGYDMNEMHNCIVEID